MRTMSTPEDIARASRALELEAAQEGLAPRPIRRFEHGSRAPGWDEPADLAKAPAEIPDPALTPEALRAEIEAHMAHYPDRRSAALPALAAAQRVHGWCSPEAIEQVACVMRVTPAYLESVASFYDMLETSPAGRHSVYVCTNISCSLCGADELHAEILEAVGADPEFSVRSFECLGACDIAPMASVDGVYVGPLTLADVPQLIDDVRAGRPVLPEKQLARRLVADPHANTREFPEHPAEKVARAGGATPEQPADTAAVGPATEEPLHRSSPTHEPGEA
jgi:NADH-quinone oxidoreductase subunit E